MFSVLVLTPEMVCWRFAAGCLNSRQHELDPLLFHALWAHLMHGTYPPDSMVREAFPKPFERLLAQGLPITEATLWHYWRHHAEGERTPVVRAWVHTVIVTPDGTHFVRVAHTRAGRRTFQMYHNFLRMPLQRGTEILLHGAVVSALA